MPRVWFLFLMCLWVSLTILAPQDSLDKETCAIDIDIGTINTLKSIPGSAW